MRLHLIISRDASGKIRTEYIGADRVEAQDIYEAAGKAGETVELYSFLQLTRRRRIEVALAPVKK
jgi:hypothetical protein